MLKQSIRKDMKEQLSHLSQTQIINESAEVFKKVIFFFNYIFE